MSVDLPNTKLIHVATVPLTFRFFRGQVGFMQSRGLEVQCISAPGALLDEFAHEQKITVHAVPMARRITPFQDLRSVFELVRIFRAEKPDIVHSHTPKGGLLGMIAAWLARVPVRCYHIRGLPLMTASGNRRRLLSVTERISCLLAHQVFCVSHSLRHVAQREGLCPPSKLVVLGGGSSNGVDADGRFHPDRVAPQLPLRARRELGIPLTAPVIGFIGRLVKDKGIVELIEAYSLLREEFPDLHMVMVGEFEARDAVPDAIRGFIERHPNIHLIGFSEDTPLYYALSDVIALPTYREGFPNVPLESAAMERPIVATLITGCIDAVQDGVTGTLVPVADSGALSEGLAEYLRDPVLRAEHGEAARTRVVAEFRPIVIWRALSDEYRRLLDSRAGRSNVEAFPWLRRRAARSIKRGLDVAVSATALGALSPLLVGLAALVRLKLGKPVFFRQQRPGKHGRAFEVLKFRTMTSKCDSQGKLLPDAERLTAFGEFLRRSSLDELPTLINVLKGQMSLVGPRPLLMQYLERYNREQARRHDVKPGVTGWAQINGRNALSWSEKFAFDVWYVDNWSLLLDLKILWGTLPKVLGRRGISHRGAATMPEFMGDKAPAT